MVVFSPPFYSPRWVSVREKLLSEWLRLMRISLMKLLYLFRRIRKIFGTLPYLFIDVVAAPMHKILQVSPSAP